MYIEGRISDTISLLPWKSWMLYVGNKGEAAKKKKVQESCRFTATFVVCWNLFRTGDFTG